MQAKLTVCLMMNDGLEKALFDDQARNQLSQICNVISWHPLREPPYPDADIVLASWGAPKLNAELLAAMPNLKMVSYAAGSIKQLVSDEFWKRDIPITTAAASNAVAVAEYTVATMVYLAKNIRHAADLYAEDSAQYTAAKNSPRGLNGLHVGLIGASYVGREVIRLLHAYDVSIAVYDPYMDASEAQRLRVTKIELDEIMARSDIVSVHAPALPATRHMIGRSQLELMKNNTFFINTARGSVVDYKALADVTPQKHIEVVIDVTDPDEPLPQDSPLRNLGNVYITPHIAGSRGNEQLRMGTAAVREIERFIAVQPLQHQVMRSDLNRIA